MTQAFISYCWWLLHCVDDYYIVLHKQPRHLQKWAVMATSFSCNFWNFSRIQNVVLHIQTWKWLSDPTCNDCIHNNTWPEVYLHKQPDSCQYSLPSLQRPLCGLVFSCHGYRHTYISGLLKSYGFMTSSTNLQWKSFGFQTSKKNLTSHSPQDF